MDAGLRLFIAIECPEEIKAELDRSMALIRRSCVKGTFSRRENFHLTLIFLGQVPAARAAEIAAAMDACNLPPFPVTIGHMGRFRRREGDILWRQIAADDRLLTLQSRLSALLREQGFSLEDRGFRPHLTMARRAVLRAGTGLAELSAKMPELTYTAAGMTLMRSELSRSGPVYTPVHDTHFPRTRA